MILGIYGASGLGTEFYELALEINKIENKWERIFFIDDDPDKSGTKLVDLDIVPYEWLQNYKKEDVELILAIGEPAVKDKVFGKVESDGYTVTNLIYPGTRIMHGAKLGKGIVIQNDNAVPPMSVIGNNVLIQGHTVLGHGVRFDDNVVISSLAFVGGDTYIGKDTYIAPHSCLRNGLHIGSGAVIGMGSVVTKDIPDNAVAFGNPCEVKRINEKGRVFSR